MNRSVDRCKRDDTMSRSCCLRHALCGVHLTWKAQVFQSLVFLLAPVTVLVKACMCIKIGPNRSPVVGDARLLARSRWPLLWRGTTDSFRSGVIYPYLEFSPHQWQRIQISYSPYNEHSFYLLSAQSAGAINCNFMRQNTFVRRNRSFLKHE